MNRDIFEGRWVETKGKIKQMWGRLTDDDLKEIEGDHQMILGKLQKYYGYSRDEAEKAVKEFKNKFRHH